MFFARFLPFLVSVFISAGLAVLGMFLPVAGARSSSYATLICSDAVPDREIRERLEDQGFTGLVSESGQWVLLDCFGSIEQIPLDEYPARVLSFDPRNDGYAEKLRSLFVRDDKRFVYIPLSSQSVHGEEIRKELASALGDIPYSFEYARRVTADRPVLLFFILFFLAAVAFFAVRPLRRALRPHAASLIPCLPALVPLATGGAAGFALASLLAGCAVIIAGPCLERFTMPQRRGLPPLLCWLLPPFLIICYVILAFFSSLPSVFTLLVLVFFGGILAFSLWSTLPAGARALNGWFTRRWNLEHQRFSPVLILKPLSFNFAFSWAMLPFAAVSLVLTCTGIIFSLSGSAAFSILPSAGVVTEADYRAHYLFQSTFSQRSLHTARAADSMGVYELASDGLPNQIPGSNEQEAPLDNIPPFPLGDLLQYPDRSGQDRAPFYELLFVLLPLFFILPILFQDKTPA
jgi:cbb3-type cytochrome oxidase subunit 3